MTATPLNLEGLDYNVVRELLFSTDHLVNAINRISLNAVSQWVPSLDTALNEALAFRQKLTDELLRREQRAGDTNDDTNSIDDP